MILMKTLKNNNNTNATENQVVIIFVCVNFKFNNFQLKKYLLIW